MKRLIVAAVLLCFAGLISTAAVAQNFDTPEGKTTQYLRDACRDAVNGLDADDSPLTPYCYGYFVGFADLYRADQLAGGKSEGGIKRVVEVICIPSAVKVQQLIEVFVSWANKHPEQLHNPRIGGLVVAFAEAFPCEKRENP